MNQGPQHPPNAEKLFEHTEFLTRLANGLVGDAHAADDLVQDAFVAALEHPPLSRSSLGSWLASVIRNRASNRLRQESNRVQRESDSARHESQDSDSLSVDRIEFQREMLDALLALPAAQRSVVYLRYYEGFTPSEIAVRQGEPVKTIKTRLSRGLASIRSHLDRRAKGGRDAWLAALAPFALSTGVSELSGPLARTGVDVGATSAAGMIGGLVMKKLMLVVAGLVAAVAGWQALRGEVASPDETQVVLAYSELASPASSPSLDVEPVEVAVAGARVAVEPVAQLTATKPEFGALRIVVTWYDGSPAEGVEVLGHTIGASSDRETDHRGVTDERGEVLLEGLIPGKFGMRVARGFIRPTPLISAGETAEFTWQHSQGETVRGVVVDGDGISVANAQIWLNPRSADWPSAFRVAITNSMGRFEVRDLDRQMMPAMGARGPGYLPSSDFGVSEMQRAPDGSREITFVLGERAGGIRGTVYDPEGMPVPGALVHAGEFGGTRIQGTKTSQETTPRLVPVATDAEGRFTLPGGYRAQPTRSSVPIHAQARGFPTWSGFVRVPESGTVEFDIQLEHGATVVGRVTDQEGRPVANAQVACAQQERGRNRTAAFPIPTAITDGEGNFRMPFVPSGFQHFNATPEKLQLGRSYRMAECASGETTTLDFQLDPYPAVSGFVVNADGEPLVGWRLDARSDLGFWRQTHTDDSGAFSLTNVGEHPMKLDVHAPNEWSQAHLTTRVHPDTEGLMLVIEEVEIERGSIAGTVRSLDGLVPEGASLWIRSEKNPNQGRGVPFDSITGEFSFGPYPVGRHRLVLMFGMRTAALSDWFEINSDETLDVGILSPLPTGRVEIIVNGVELDKADDPRIYVRRDGYLSGTVQWTEGRLLSSELAEGRWMLITSGKHFFAPTPVDVVEGKTQTVRIEIQPSLILRLQLEFANDDWSEVEYSFRDQNGDLLLSQLYGRGSLELTGYGLATRLPRGWVTAKMETDNGLVVTADFEVTDSPAGQEPHSVCLE